MISNMISNTQIKKNLQNVKPKEYKIGEGIHMIELKFVDYPLCIVNTIRRILLSEIPIIGLRVHKEDNVSVITKNQSPIHNEYLELRIGLIPIHYSKLNNMKILTYWDKENHTRKYELEHSNTKYYNIKNIHTDFYGLGDNSITNNYMEKISNISGIDDCVKQSYVMSHGKEIETEEISLQVGRGIEDSRFSPISYFSWNFHEGNVDFLKEREFQLNKKYKNDPQQIIMNLKSDHMDPSKLYETSLFIIKHKLYDLYKFKLTNENISYFDDNKSDSESVVLIIKEENDTIGNLISQMGKHYLADEKNYIKFITYKITHPLENDIMIRISLKNDPFLIANELNIEYNDKSNEERYRIYKLLVIHYIKELIKYILSHFLNMDIKKDGSDRELYNTYIDRKVNDESE